MTADPHAVQRTCSIDDCDRPVVARGWCMRHYRRWRRHNDPLATPRPKQAGPQVDPEVRFWAKVDENGPVPEHRPELGGCWFWTGYRNEEGYGVFSFPDRNVVAHRVAYEFAVGPISPGLVLDHLCRVRGCVRPDHLEPVTNEENVRRAIRNRRLPDQIPPDCNNGHDLTGDNLRITWVCRACQREALERSYAKRRRQRALETQDSNVIQHLDSTGQA